MIRDKNFTLTRYSSCKQKSPKKRHTPLRLLLDKAITGARAVKVKNSPSVTAAIKAAALPPLSLKPVSPRRFISVAVSSQRMAFCVMEVITLFDALTENAIIFKRLHMATASAA